MISICSVSDAVAGDYITIFTKYDGSSYYVGWSNGSDSRKEVLVSETFPRDLMASTYHGPNTKGAIKLGTVIWWYILYFTLVIVLRQDRISESTFWFVNIDKTHWAELLPCGWQTHVNFYSLRAKSLRRNIYMCSRFISFLNSDMAQVVEIISVWDPPSLHSQYHDGRWPGEQESRAPTNMKLNLV